MAIEAPISKFTKTNLKIYIILCIAVAAWFAYDGYINKTFIEKNTDDDGSPNSTLIFNQKAPPFFAAAAVFFGAYLFVIKDRKLIADENELIFNNKKRIPYEAIEKINKTHFRSKHKSTTVKREFVGHPNGVLEESNEEVKEECKDEPTGYFIITYKNKDGKEIDRKISDRKYDNLAAILDHLVLKIS